MLNTQMNEILHHLRSTMLLRDGLGLTDKQLLDDYLSRREEAALAALVRRHGPMVWGVCRRGLRNYHDAEDAFQATFLVFVRKAASIASKDLLANWLYGVAYQTAWKARTTAARRKTRERQVMVMPESEVPQEDSGHDLLPVLDMELSRLPDKYRIPIVLCDLEGKTRKEAAEQLGCPEGTVAGRLARARLLLAKRIARHGLVVSGGMLAAVLSASAASASVPSALVSSTIKAATLFAAGPAAADVISVKVAALAEGVLKSMLLIKLQGALVALLLGVGLLIAGSGYLMPTPAAEKSIPSAILMPKAVKPGHANKLQADAPDKGLKQAWSLEGTWTGVVSDPGQGAIYTIGGGKCVEVDVAGKQQREFNIPQERGSLVRLAAWRGEVRKALLTFSVWTAELTAYDLSGKQLWSYPRLDGIDDIWAHDLKGEGSDQIIVGYNGGTGLHVLDATGKLLWKSNAIGNAWNVCAGDVLGDGKPQVVTTSAAGKVHLFEGSGKQGKDLDAGCYAIMVRIGKLSAKDKAATIFVAGTALDEGANPMTVILAAMNSDGANQWTLKIPTGPPPRVVSAQLASGKPWLAVGVQGGQVHVVDIEKGAIIASVKDQGMTPEVGWARGDGKDDGAPLLLVATGGKLNAYRVAGSK
jgi:RNA polymerase sigma factor (sigma-70 family)